MSVLQHLLCPLTDISLKHLGGPTQFLVACLSPVDESSDFVNRLFSGRLVAKFELDKRSEVPGPCIEGIHFHGLSEPIEGKCPITAAYRENPAAIKSGGGLFRPSVRRLRAGRRRSHLDSSQCRRQLFELIA